MAEIILSCFVLGTGYALSVDICKRNKISDSCDVDISNLTIDHLRKLIWNKIKNWRDMEDVKYYNELVLWKVEVPLEKLNNSLTKIEIEQLGGLEMDTINKFRKFFPEGYITSGETINIIVELPFTFITGKCLPMFYLSNKKFALSHIFFYSDREKKTQRLGLG